MYLYIWSTCEFDYNVIQYSMIFHTALHWKHFPCYWPFAPGIHRSPVNSLHKGQWRGSFDVFYDLCLNKPWGWRFEMPSRPLWCHCNDINQGFNSQRHPIPYPQVPGWAMGVYFEDFGKYWLCYNCTALCVSISTIVYGLPQGDACNQWLCVQILYNVLNKLLPPTEQHTMRLTLYHKNKHYSPVSEMFIRNKIHIETCRNKS